MNYRMMGYSAFSLELGLATNNKNKEIIYMLLLSVECKVLINYLMVYFHNVFKFHF